MHSEAIRYELSVFEKGDRVVTPTGETARVIAERDGRVELEYDQPLRRDHAGISLPVRLVRKIVEGERTPAPVRIEP